MGLQYVKTGFRSFTLKQFRCKRRSRKRTNKKNCNWLRKKHKIENLIGTIDFHQL